MNGLISVIASIAMFIVALLLGKASGGKVEKVKAETTKAREEAHHNMQTAAANKAEAVLAQKAAESVVEAQKAESERVLTEAEIQDKLASAMKSGDQTILFELAGQMAQRARERIER